MRVATPTSRPRVFLPGVWGPSLLAGQVGKQGLQHLGLDQVVNLDGTGALSVQWLHPRSDHLTVGQWPVHRNSRGRGPGVDGRCRGTSQS